MRLRTLTHLSAQQAPHARQTPSRNYAQRIIMRVQDTRLLDVEGPVNSVVVLDAALVRAEVAGTSAITLTALAQGETMIILSRPNWHETIMVDVRARPSLTAEEIAARGARRRTETESLDGFFTVHFSPATSGHPALLKHTFEFRRKLSTDRDLRVQTDAFKFFGGGERGFNLPATGSVGLNRLSLGIDSRAGSLDLLDSELSISPLSFYGFSMRGLHIVSKSESGRRGMEAFAGLARPALTLFDQRSGFLAGAIMPVIEGSGGALRVGVIATFAREKLVEGRGGLALHADGRYAAAEQFAIEGEAAYANGGLSWRARLDLRRGPFSFYGESLSLDRLSPLASIGAQPRGRRMDALNLNWQPTGRISASLSFNRAASALYDRSGRAKLSGSNLLASFDYRLAAESRLGLRFSQQEVETSNTAQASPLKINTRKATAEYNVRFGQHWSNDLEAGVSWSVEQNAGASVERGLRLKNELRRSWRGGNAAAYLDYSSNTPSLAGLLVRNSQLLPPLLHAAYRADPARFLTTNRDLLSTLLTGIDLPATRSLDLGLRIQGALSRANFAAEMRYSGGAGLANDRRNLIASFGASLRLDAANSVQVTGSRAAPLHGPMAAQSTFMVSYTHRFGGEANHGFQFKSLLGLDGCHIRGRVFLDLNSNGRDDADEPGLAGMTVQIDGERRAMTDARGRFRFPSMRPGQYTVALIGDALGARLRATTAMEQSVSLASGESLNLGFGLTNFGFVSGRIFNDLSLTGEYSEKAPGVGGVHLSLRPMGSEGRASILEEIVDGSGIYRFRNLLPGTYLLEIDAATLPADFKLPRQTSWTVQVSPLEGFFLDIPLAAQRAMTGRVFVDQDGDGQFDPEKDRPLEAARVTAGGRECLTDVRGIYILRDLPSGKLKVHARLRSGVESEIRMIEMGVDPDIYSGINLPFKPGN